MSRRVQRPGSRPDGTVFRITWEAGGEGGRAAEGVEMGEAAAGVANLHIHEGDRVLRPEGKSPDRGIQIHIVVNTDKPGFHELSSLG